jgi:hypothetical protein
MGKVLLLLPAVFKLVQALASIFTKWQAKREARQEVAGEIAIQEVQKANEVADVMAQPRSPDDVARRLRDGNL